MRMKRQLSPDNLSPINRHDDCKLMLFQNLWPRKDFFLYQLLSIISYISLVPPVYVAHIGHLDTELFVVL